MQLSFIIDDIYNVVSNSKHNSCKFGVSYQANGHYWLVVSIAAFMYFMLIGEVCIYVPVSLQESVADTWSFQQKIRLVYRWVLKIWFHVQKVYKWKAYYNVIVQYGRCNNITFGQILWL